jgi:hypothetical protein
MAKKNEIATVNMGALPVVGLGANLGQLTKLTKSTSYLRRIQLYSKGKAVDTRQIDPGCFGVPADDNIQSLGPEIDIIPLVVRSKAIDAKDRDAVIVSYDETTDAFAEIRERAETKDSKCMWGFAFLVYERSTGDYYEMFFGTKTARNEVPNLVPFLPRTPEQEAEMTEQLGKTPQPSGPCTVKSKYITKGDWGWHAPVVHPCSTPFKGFNTEIALEQMNKFAALKDSVIEKVEEEATGRAR